MMQWILQEHKNAINFGISGMSAQRARIFVWTEDIQYTVPTLKPYSSLIDERFYAGFFSGRGCRVPATFECLALPEYVYTAIYFDRTINFTVPVSCTGPPAVHGRPSRL
eukprot:SAG31_NODE_302_length_18087_cov_97.056982_21_plen_109_part_00